VSLWSKSRADGLPLQSRFREGLGLGEHVEKGGVPRPTVPGHEAKARAFTGELSRSFRK